MNKEILKNIGIYFITDSKITRKGIFSDVTDVIKAGCKIVQYREKNKSKEEMIGDAFKLRKICSENNVIFIINDFVDLALEVDADGVHIGQEDEAYDEAREKLGKNKIIGVTAHNLREALDAQKKGADYIGVSPIFNTSTKKDAGEGMGIFGLKEIVSKVNIPCVAIGGINKENIKSVFETGVSGIAMISAIINNDCVARSFEELDNMIIRQ